MEKGPILHCLGCFPRLSIHPKRGTEIDIERSNTFVSAQAAIRCNRDREQKEE
jgi:hypothetical protein